MVPKISDSSRKGSPSSFLVQIQNADVYLNDHKALSSINWSMGKKESWAVVGNNGAGKTSFLKLIYGELIPAWGGTVRWFGKRESQTIWDVRARVGIVSAEYQEGYTPRIAGLQVVASGFFSSIGIYETLKPGQEKKALEWMSFLGIDELADKGFHRMSYGESRRVLLARALVNDPSLLILDEPCNGLDIPTKELFLETIEKLSRTQTRLIYATHHIDEILPSISHVLYLKNGTVHLQGKKTEMLKSDVLSKVLNCEITLAHNGGRYWVTGSRRKTNS